MTCEGEYPNLLRIVWQQWKFAFFSAFFYWDALFLLLTIHLEVICNLEIHYSKYFNVITNQFPNQILEAKSNMDKKKLFFKIRVHNLTSFLLSLFFVFASVAFWIVACIIDESVIGIILSIFFTVLTVVIIFCVRGSILMVLMPEESLLFKRFGGVHEVQRILFEMNYDTIYSDHAIVMSNHYCYPTKDIEGLVAYNDILMIHKLVHKTNFVIDSYNVVITNNYGQQFTCQYSRNEEDKCNTVMLIIAQRSPNAVIGYSSAALAYVESNKLSLKDLKRIN